MRILLTALALTLALPMAACSPDASEAQSAATIPVTIAMGGQSHRFAVEVARTDEEQKQGLKFRTSLPVDGGMIFPFEKPRNAGLFLFYFPENSRLFHRHISLVALLLSFNASMNP